MLENSHNHMKDKDGYALSLSIMNTGQPTNIKKLITVKCAREATPYS